VNCGYCSEKDCKKEHEEIDGMHYIKCVHTGRMPEIMAQNAKIWNMLRLIKDNLLFRHYPFMLRTYLESLGLTLSESELGRLSYIYTLYIHEKMNKHPLKMLSAMLNI
jgi:hypothetical protein